MNKTFSNIIFVICFISIALNLLLIGNYYSVKNSSEYFELQFKCNDKARKLVEERQGAIFHSSIYNVKDKVCLVEYSMFSGFGAKTIDIEPITYFHLENVLNTGNSLSPVYVSLMDTTKQLKPEHVNNNLKYQEIRKKYFGSELKLE